MNKFTGLLLSSFLLFGAVACTDGASNDASAPAPGESASAPTAEQAQDAKEDATSETRREQLNADIRAREERDQALGSDDGTRSDSDLASQVRSKLEANLPASGLTAEAQDGVVTIAGTVPTQEQYARIEPLAREIRGVQQVQNQAQVAPATPQPQAN